MRSTLGVLLVLAMSMTGLVAPSNVATADPDGLYRWRGRAAMISNFGLYRSREFIYQDYIYDDHGPNTDGVNHTDVPLGGSARGNDATSPRLGSSGGQIRHAGDFMYAADGSGYYANAADLIEFRVARHRNRARRG